MLTCLCDDDYAYYYTSSDDFITVVHQSKCSSCKKIIPIHSTVLQFTCFTEDDDGYRQLPTQYLCEKCGEIYLNLTTIGYCYSLGDDIREYRDEYHELTGFTPPKEGSDD